MQPSIPMTPIHDARAVFDALADRREPRLADVAGTWTFDLGGAGTWSVAVDRGDLRVVEGPASDGDAPSIRLRLTEEDLVRIAQGDDENLMSAVLRGTVAIEGDLELAQPLMHVLPLPAKWRAAA